ncbi:MAG: YggS family pyridoxal phosphate-dependent enzyme [Chromatiales bacterium]|nr:YggS family pyridoxal phosphate-dependent enzyme [Chromatiales bacterium]
MLAESILQHNLDGVRGRIAAAERRAGRPAGSVRLLAVTKGHAAGQVLSGWRAGIREVGESYVQEASVKQAACVATGLVWHFIGRPQRGNLKAIAQRFDWVHGLASVDHALKLDQTRASCAAEPLNVCIQVNLSEEAQKNGVRQSELPGLIERIRPLRHIRLRGLMTMSAGQDSAPARSALFEHAAQLFSELSPAAGDRWDTLSMGMSDDFEIAIAAGSTIVRVGTAIFGPRSNNLRNGS